MFTRELKFVLIESPNSYYIQKVKSRSVFMCVQRERYQVVTTVPEDCVTGTYPSDGITNSVLDGKTS